METSQYHSVDHIKSAVSDFQCRKSIIPGEIYPFSMAAECENPSKTGKPKHIQRAQLIN